MKAILIEKNAFEEMHKNIKEVKNELANMKKELLSESNNFLTVVKTIIMHNS